MWYENLRLYRERHDLSQKEWSDRLGISERTLQRYESGESEPTVSVLLKLSQIYDISIDVLLSNDVNSTFNISRIERYLREIERSCNTLRREMYEAENNSLI